MEAPQLLRVGYPVRLCELKAEALKNAWGRVEALPSEPGGRCAVRVVYPAGARAAYAAPIALKPSNLHRLSVGSETDWYYAYPLREFVEEEATSASLQLSKEAAGGDARVTPVLCSSPAVGAVLSRLRSVARVALFLALTSPPAATIIGSKRTAVSDVSRKLQWCTGV